MPSASSPPRLPPDPVIEAYKQDVDRSLLRENLKLAVEERLRRLVSMIRFVQEMWRAGREATRRH